MTTRLLFDGDVIAFVAAAGVQHNLEDSFGYIWPFANVAEGEAAVENMLSTTARKLAPEGDFEVEVYLSDPEANFRKEIFAGYKENRKGNVRPLLLAKLKDYLRAEHGAVHWDGLEADDVLGILSTSSPYDTIIVGRDKDFLTIPGRYHRIKHFDGAGAPIITTTTLADANRWHLIQTLAGDRTDGYDGCPGLGMERAARIIDDPHILKPTKGIVTRGPRKGVEITKWVGEPTDDLWACVVSHYEKEGLTEEDALRNARLAYLLRADAYDMDTGRITLWVPDTLTNKET